MSGQRRAGRAVLEAMTKFIILAAIALIVVAVIYRQAGRVKAAEIPESHLAPLDDARAAILEVQVNAALAGHDLGTFAVLDTTAGGYEAHCRKCDKSVWVGDQGLIYSLLGESCAG
jgi:hypothetical protein